MRTRWMVALLVVAALALSACGGSRAQTGPTPTVNSVEPVEQGTQVPTTAAGSGTGMKATAAPATVAAFSVKGTTTPVLELPGTEPAGDTLNLQNRETGLDQLKSYRLSWQAEWSSITSGKTESAGWDWQEEYSGEPAGLHWTWKSNDPTDTSKSSVMEAWQVGATTYMKTSEAEGQNNCISYSSADQSSQLTKGIFSPDILGQVENAKYVGTETVNGINAKHYKYDQVSANLAALGKVSGEMWVAVDGGYVVKDTVNWEGGAGLFGTSSTDKGSGKWTWELTDVNQPITIAAPPECAGAASGLPMMADATDKAVIGDMTTYKSASKLADIVSFYQKEMVAAGWAADGEPTVSDQLSNLAFTKGGQKAQITVSEDNGSSQVLVQVTK